jgi:hypothetical protein
MSRCLRLLALAALVAAGTSCEQTQVGIKAAADAKTHTTLASVSSRKSAAEVKSAQSNEDKPLLLDEPAGSTTTDGSGADNSRCQVCHLNLAQEELAVSHARANIGCAGCHGASDAHIADESWASGGNGTAPDIMFPQAKLNPCCLECHPQAKIDSDQHKDFFAGKGEEKYCLDCHGKHRLVNRKCKWK